MADGAIKIIAKYQRQSLQLSNKSINNIKSNSNIIWYLFIKS